MKVSYISEAEYDVLEDILSASKMDTWFYTITMPSLAGGYIPVIVYDLEEEKIFEFSKALELMDEGLDLDSLPIDEYKKVTYTNMYIRIVMMKEKGLE